MERRLKATVSISNANSGYTIVEEGRTYTILGDVKGKRYEIVPEHGTRVIVPKAYFEVQVSNQLAEIQGHDGQYEVLRRGGKNSRVRPAGTTGKGFLAPNDRIHPIFEVEEPVDEAPAESLSQENGVPKEGEVLLSNLLG